MKPTKKHRQVISNFEGEDITMELDSLSTVHLMEILTSPYSDPELAVLREYATNAYDSHLEAGIKRPIEIELPKSLRASLIVRDFGVGLSKDEIKEVYSQYGASTKRNSNKYNGILGIGCKSGLTYADQFSVRARKDGWETLVSVSRDEKGQGKMKILRHTKNYEPNGVEITIPTKTTNDFTNKAYSLFKFWPKDSVLVDGKEPVKIEGKKISSNFLVQNSGESQIVQGNVPYPIDDGFFVDLGVTIYAPIGSVDFVPSREHLQDTKLTRDSLGELEERFKNACASYINKKIKNCKSKHQALNKIADIYDVILDNCEEINFKGEKLPLGSAFYKVPDIYNYSEDFHLVLIDEYSYSVRTRKHDYRQASSVDFRRASDSVWVVGFDNKTYNYTMYKKIKAFLEQKGVDKKPILIKEETFENIDWLDPSIVFCWSEVKKAKIENHNKNKKTFYQGFSRLSHHYPAYLSSDKIKEDYSLVFYSQEKLDKHSFDKLKKELGYFECCLVWVPSNRKNKFLVSFPEAIRYDEFMSTVAMGWWDSLDKNEKNFLVGNIPHKESQLGNLFAKKDNIVFADDRLNEILKKQKKISAKQSKLQKQKGFYSQFFVGKADESIDTSSPLDEYPSIIGSLLSSYYHSGDDYAESAKICIDAIYEKKVKVKV